MSTSVDQGTAAERVSQSDTGLAPEPVGPGESRRAGVSRGVLTILERYGLVVLFVITCIIFSVWSKTSELFTSPDNLRLIGKSQAILVVLALASIIPLVCGQFDLSVGANAGIAHIVVAAGLTRFDVPLVVAIVVAVAITTFIGLLNGLLVAKVGVNALITTLGMATVLGGVARWYMKGTQITIDKPALTNLASKNLFGIPRSVIVIIPIAAFIYYLLGHTPFGRYLSSIGSNPTAARLVGLGVDRMVIASFLLSGFFSGVAGVLLLADTGSAGEQAGNPLTFVALAAAFLGATTIKPGRFNVLGTLVAVYFLAVAANGLNYAGIQEWIKDVLNGGALVFAVAVAAILGRRRSGAG